jgi:hypothetical protein
MSAAGTLQALGIFDRGVPYMERVLFQALTPVSLAFYVVLHSTSQGTVTVNSGSHPAFWFPTIQLVAGEQIILYTGPNRSPQNIGPQGRAFFWGLNKTIFNTPEDCVVVMQILDWLTVGNTTITPQPGNVSFLGFPGSTKP